MRKSIAALIAGVVLIIVAAGIFVWFVTHEPQPRAARTQLHDIEHHDGMLYDNVEPWVDPAPPFPLHCAHPAYCELSVDSVCTIVYVMINTGTAEPDIVAALWWQREEIRSDDFTACRGFEHYWSGVVSPDS